ncbi:response regulator [Massilia antarctica]|uniref:response regulator n=1 Tax=Massilia antarctica TaxID=2765360 RepID=UPI0006BB5ACC|nr:response regulator [Massilia sp. H27-R4]MCY0910206.1 response regulator [Massilia sp. H27-R4]CUI02699.1 Chemotaxis protein methyltransferase CheR [Janthinobacterium sp. CG23_2]CUU26485.1 Chemotaxis protein methyltransferase CheR [Janthinobacterium sp. CG23_2]
MIKQNNKTEDEPKGRINILLVDDQRANLTVLEAVLAELDEVLVSVTSGEQALRELLNRDFAMVLMDVHMPTMSGFEAAALIRSHPRARTLPIIFLTAAGDDPSHVEHAYALGAVDYLTKPVSPVILRAKVAVFIDLYRKTAEIALHAQASHREALRTRDERIRLILDNTRDYAFIGTDTDGIVTEWEGGAETITGWFANKACGQSSAIIFSPEDRAAGVPEHEMRMARDTGRAEDKRWHVRRDGTRFFADGVMVPLRDESERLRGYAKIFRDATPERLAAEQLEASEQQLDESRQRSQRAEEGMRRLAAVAAQSSDFIGIAGSDGRTGYVNPAGRRLAGLAPDASVGDYGIADFFAPDCRVFVEQVVLPAVRGAAGRWEGELRMRNFDSDTILPVYYKGFAVCDDEGHNIGLASITRDITAQKQAENDLRRVAADLAEADRRKSEFLATLAHELRNPLAPIRTGLDLIRMSSAPPQSMAKVHEMMDRQLGHLIHLVNDLLDVARITRGKIELKREASDVATLAAMAIETSMAALNAGGHTFKVEVAEAPLPLDVDITRIVQVLSNLLNNAAKYTPGGGHIVLRAVREGDDAVLSVIDSGVGISQEDMGTLFDMFTQVGRNLDRSQGGLGIGLSLVRRLVELHGGKVSAASAGRDLGSTFTVRLPLRSGMPAPAAPPCSNNARAALRVLVVDDNVDAGNSLAELLQALGHSTDVAVDGEQGLVLAAQGKPHLAFLDIGLPGMSGHQLARAIRAMPALDGMLLVALTGWGARADVIMSQQAGFDRHLTKPVDIAALNSVLAAAAAAAPPAATPAVAPPPVATPPVPTPTIPI